MPEIPIQSKYSPPSSAVFRVRPRVPFGPGQIWWMPSGVSVLGTSPVPPGICKEQEHILGWGYYSLSGQGLDL